MLPFSDTCLVTYTDRNPCQDGNPNLAWDLSWENLPQSDTLFKVKSYQRQNTFRARIIHIPSWNGI